MEMVRAYEYQANGESSACIGEGRCRKAQWQAPKPTKDDVAAVDEYRKERQALEELFHKAKQICLRAP